MKIFLLLFASVLLSTSFAQTKYLIYFTDKGINANEQLEKSSSLYQSALSELTEKCINRRIKNLGEENIISFEDIPINPDYISSLESRGIKIENNLKWFNAVSAYLTLEQVDEIIQFDYVKKVEPVRILKFKNELPQSTGDLTKQTAFDFPINYGDSFDQLQLSDIPIVHSRGITGDSVLIGMLDTGFDWKNHESLKDARIIAEYDFINQDSVTADEDNDQPGQHDHGTLTFSVIGGYKDSSLIGPAFDSDFVLAKTEDIRSETHVEEDNFAAALIWMENLGVDISSSSLGYSDFDQSTFSYTYADMDGNTTIVTQASEIAFGKGILTVTSAGNEGLTSWIYITAPADGFNTIGVGAVDGSNEVVGFSSRGPTFDGRIKPDVVTRGVFVYGARAGNFSGYRRADGTSLSAPIAAGIASLLLSAHPHLKNTQLRSILLETADNSSLPDNNRGYGLLSALNSIEYPNLEEESGNFRLHKTIISESDFDPFTMSLHYTINEENQEPVPMNYDGVITFNYLFPSLIEGDVVEFYFTFSDSSGNAFRVPDADNYKFIYGQLNVSQNLKLQTPSDIVEVNEIYPNPFIINKYQFAHLQFFSEGNEKFRVIIIDASGQQVKMYETITTEGTNYFSWNGISDRGILCASGVYYYLVRLGEKDFGRKMILMK